MAQNPHSATQFRIPLGPGELRASEDSGRGIAEGVEDAYVIEGWGLHVSWDNAFVKKFVI